jgi:hypothetical protein
VGNGGTAPVYLNFWHCSGVLYILKNVKKQKQKQKKKKRRRRRRRRTTRRRRSRRRRRRRRRKVCGKPPCCIGLCNCGLCYFCLSVNSGLEKDPVEGFCEHGY